MKEDNEIQELASAFAALPLETTPDQSCPPATLIWETLRLEAPEAERRRVVEHIARCGSCANAWRLAHEISQSAPEPGFGVPRPQSSRLAWMGLATAATLMIGVALVQLVSIKTATRPLSVQSLPKAPADGSGPVYRVSGELEIFSGLNAAEPVSRGHCLLQWRVTPETAGMEYQIEVLDENLNPIVSDGRLSTNEFLVPQSKLDALSPGSSIFWQVRAEWPDGRSLSRTFNSLLK